MGWAGGLVQGNGVGWYTGGGDSGWGLQGRRWVGKVGGGWEEVGGEGGGCYKAPQGKGWVA